MAMASSPGRTEDESAASAAGKPVATVELGEDVLAGLFAVLAVFLVLGFGFHLGLQNVRRIRLANIGKLMDSEDRVRGNPK